MKEQMLNFGNWTSWKGGEYETHYLVVTDVAKQCIISNYPIWHFIVVNV